MPRLPRILATEGVQPTKGASIPYGAADTGAGAILAGSNRVIEAVSQYAALEQRKKHLAVQSEAGLLQADIEMGVSAQDVNLRATERDPEAYTTRFEGLVQSTLADVRKRAKSPEAAQIAEAQVRRSLDRMRVESYKHSNTLYMADEDAKLDATLEQHGLLAGLAPDDEEFRAQLAAGETALTKATGRIGAKAAGEKYRTWRESVLSTRADKEAHDDPNAFALEADVRFAMLDPKKREQLKQAAVARIESQRKSANQEWEAWYKRIEEDHERERQGQLTAMRADALSGSLTIATLDDMRRMGRVITGEEYSTLFKIVTEEKAYKSDERTLTDVQIRSRAAVPRIGSDELDSLLRAKKLNKTDWAEAKDKVLGRLDYLKSEGRTENNQAHTQAEQLVITGLGISTKQDEWTREDAQLVNRALDELTARSKAFKGGTEDPLAVARDLMERYSPIRDQRIKLKSHQYRGTLPVDLRGQRAEEAMQKLTEAQKAGRYTDQQTNAYKRTILDWRRIQTVEDGDQARPSAGAGSKLRDPNKKPESGKE